MSTRSVSHCSIWRCYTASDLALAHKKTKFESSTCTIKMIFTCPGQVLSYTSVTKFSLYFSGSCIPINQKFFYWILLLTCGKFLTWKISLKAGTATRSCHDLCLNQWHCTTHIKHNIFPVPPASVSYLASPVSPAASSCYSNHR